MSRLILPFMLVCSVTCFSQKKDMRDGVYSAHLYLVEVSKNIVLGTIDTTNSIYEDSIIKL
jgi:hypothetical protein